eukprot:Sdes_comp10395_c0_seq1m2052
MGSVRRLSVKTSKSFSFLIFCFLISTAFYYFSLRTGTTSLEAKLFSWAQTDQTIPPPDFSLKRILVTGAAGFIGHHLCKELHAQGHFVVGMDNFNDYYDVELKYMRAYDFEKLGIPLHVADVCDQSSLQLLFRTHRFTHVVHLAAQAGVRYSLVNPYSYVKANLDCFVRLLEVVKQTPKVRFVYASSSSVYGANKKQPFSTLDRVDHPTSIYGATKKANEAIAHAYHHMYGIPMAGLRFFTVYGPFGRPDMAVYEFSEKIVNGVPLNVYERGNLKRDFTYVGDIVDGVIAAVHCQAPFEVFNLGKGHPEDVNELIAVLETSLQKKAIKHFVPMPPGDVPLTFADTSLTEAVLKVKPAVSLREGIARWTKWYLSYKHARDDFDAYLIRNSDYSLFRSSLIALIAEYSAQNQGLMKLVSPSVCPATLFPCPFAGNIFIPVPDQFDLITACTVESTLLANPNSVVRVASREALPAEWALLNSTGSLLWIDLKEALVNDLVWNERVQAGGPNQAHFKLAVGASLVRDMGGVFLDTDVVVLRIFTEIVNSVASLKFHKDAYSAAKIGSSFFSFDKKSAFLDSFLEAFDKKGAVTDEGFLSQFIDQCQSQDICEPPYLHVKPAISVHPFSPQDISSFLKSNYRETGALQILTSSPSIFALKLSIRDLVPAEGIPEDNIKAFIMSHDSASVLHQLMRTFCPITYKSLSP